jgi:hypothetical protein
MATSARYSSDEFFEGRQFEAMEVYARTAWLDILKQAFSSDLEMDLYTVAATNMLAVIDFTGIATTFTLTIASRSTNTIRSWKASPRLGQNWFVCQICTGSKIECGAEF